jgi:hypothetical protein
MLRRHILGGALSCVLLLTITATLATGKTPEEQALKVGKRGEITLTQSTVAAGQTLPPATYIIQHRDSGNDHFVRFLKVVKVEANTSEEGGYPYTERDNVGEIKCRMEPMSEAARETTAYVVIENGVPRITRVAIKGERAQHVL